MYAEHLTQKSYWALMFDELEEYEETIEGLSRFLESHQMNSAAFNNRGVAYYEIGQNEKALKDFESAISCDTNNSMPYRLKGDLFKKLGENQKAIENYTRFIEIKGDASSYLSRAYAYVEMNLPREAIEDFSSAIELDPKNKQTYLARGRAYEQISEKDKAIEDFKKLREK